MTYTIGPRQTFEPLPTGEYMLTLKEWREYKEEEDSAFSKKGDVKVEWTFEVAVPNAEPTVRKARTSIPASFSEKSHFVHIITALGLVDANTGAEGGCTVDLDAGIGKRCVGTIVKKLKTGKTNEYTDSITVYAPLPAQLSAPLVFGGSAPASPTPSTAAPTDALRARYNALMSFAGLPKLADTAVAAGGIQQSMIAVGAQPLNETARVTLNGAVEFLLSLSGTDYRTKFAEVRTLRDGLLLLDVITKELDALGDLPF